MRAVEDILLPAALAAAVLTAGGALALYGYFALQGDCDIVVRHDDLAELVVDFTENRLSLRFVAPVHNKGRQKGMVVEFLCRPEFPGKFFRDLSVATKVHSPARRIDGYWEAILMEKGQTVPVVFEISFSGPRQALKQLRSLPHLDFVVHYQVIGRVGMKWRTDTIRVPLAPVSH